MSPRAAHRRLIRAAHAGGMRPLPLLPLFVGAVGVAVAAVAVVMATDAWWAVGLAFTVLLAMLTVIGTQVLLYLGDRLD